MSFRKFIGVVSALSLMLSIAQPASATDGHFLHGVGAVNSAMGGAGVAAPGDLMGAFYLNPAGLKCTEGSRIALGFELFKPQRTVSSDFGFASGETVSKSDFVPIPSFGWSTRINDKVSIGLGGIGIGGFGVDYPSADNSNPILAPRPYGYGQVTSNFQLMKIIPAFSYEVNEKLTLGFGLNVDWASLAVDPMPVAAPDVDPGPDGTPFTQDDRAFYPRATAADGAFGIGFQAGLIFAPNENLRLGLAYTSPQNFQDFEFNATHENPNLPNFGTAYSIDFAMDVPAVYSAGFAVMKDRFLWTGDARYITYESTAGFDNSGFDPSTMAVQGFGWENILVLGSGLQFRPVEKFALRGGYNYSQNPIPDDLSAFNIPAPAVVQHHLTMGLGFQLSDDVTMDLGYYHAFANEIAGPMQTPMGPMPGTEIKSEMYEDSFLMTFSFNPGG